MGQKSLTQKNLSQIEPNQKKPKDILAFPKKVQVILNTISLISAKGNRCYVIFAKSFDSILLVNNLDKSYQRNPLKSVI